MSAALLKSQSPASSLRTKPDRRRHKRVELSLNGRFLHDGADHTFLTANVSCGGAIVQARAIPQVGAAVVCYFDDLGRVSGEVVRHTEDGFAVTFKASDHKKDKLSEPPIEKVTKRHQVKQSVSHSAETIISRCMCCECMCSKK